MQISDAIKSRSSCRAFTDQPVTKDTLEQLMELAGQRAQAVRDLGPNPMKGV